VVDSLYQSITNVVHQKVDECLANCSFDCVALRNGAAMMMKGAMTKGRKPIRLSRRRSPWGYAEQADGRFGCSGTFALRTFYRMPAGSTRLQPIVDDVDDTTPPPGQRFRLAVGRVDHCCLVASVRATRIIRRNRTIIARRRSCRRDVRRRACQDLSVQWWYKYDGGCAYSGGTNMMEGVRNVYVRQPDVSK
jgi:hypothetical protein